MKNFGYTSVILFMGILAFFILLQYRNSWAMNIVNFCIRPFPHKWGDKIVGMVHSFTDGLKILKDVRGFFASLALSCCVWAAMIFAYYPINLAFGLESQLPMVTSIFIVCLTVGIFISVVPTPAFLGSFHLACVVALNEIFGIPEAIAASYGIIAWLVAMGFIIVAGLFFIVKDNISFSELATSKGRAV
jgi:uncharacterized membrane protein YbhN (UPF0104 family)